LIASNSWTISGTSNVEHVGARGAQRDLGCTSKSAFDLTDGLDHTGPEDERVVVRRVRGEPAKRAFIDRAPLAEERRLAESGRRREQNESRTCFLQGLAEPRTREHLRGGVVAAKLGLEKEAASGPTPVGLGRAAGVHQLGHIASRFTFRSPVSSRGRRKLAPVLLLNRSRSLLTMK
jgi:hypothetical protein